MRRMVAMAVMAAGLTACSHGDGGNNSSSESAGGGQTQAEPADNMLEDPANGLEPVQIPTSAPVSTIPAAFRGRWAAVPDDCAAAGKRPGPGLLVVGASGVSVGGAALAVRSLSVAGPVHLGIVTAASPGHPATTEHLSLVEDGRTLIRQQQAPAAAVPYLRCPA